MKTIIINDEKAIHKPASELRIAGLTRFTTIDFPDCLSAVVFLKGCPWRCAYCQNPELQTREFSEMEERVSWEYLENFLKKRRGLLDGLVFSGGEPFTDPALYSAIKVVEELGYKIGIHTAGMYPEKLKEVLPMVDWVGLDIKAPLSSENTYCKVVGKPNFTKRVRDSLDALLQSDVSLEVRTTVHPDLLTDEDILLIGKELKEAGVSTFAVQVYRQPPESDESNSLPRVGSDYPASGTISQLHDMFETFTLRRS